MTISNQTASQLTGNTLLSVNSQDTESKGEVSQSVLMLDSRYARLIPNIPPPHLFPSIQPDSLSIQLDSLFSSSRDDPDPLSIFLPYPKMIEHKEEPPTKKQKRAEEKSGETASLPLIPSEIDLITSIDGLEEKAKHVLFYIIDFGNTLCYISQAALKKFLYSSDDKNSVKTLIHFGFIKRYGDDFYLSTYFAEQAKKIKRKLEAELTSTSISLLYEVLITSTLEMFCSKTSPLGFRLSVLKILDHMNAPGLDSAPYKKWASNHTSLYCQALTQLGDSYIEGSKGKSVNESECKKAIHYYTQALNLSPYASEARAILYEKLAAVHSSLLASSILESSFVKSSILEQVKYLELAFNGYRRLGQLAKMHELKEQLITQYRRLLSIGHYQKEEADQKIDAVIHTYNTMNNPAIALSSLIQLGSNSTPQRDIQMDEEKLK